MKKNRKKNTDETNPDYNKIKKEVKNSFYNYDKIFIDLIVSLNECKTKKQLLSFSNSLTIRFEDAPDELSAYLNQSINNKMQSLTRKEDLDLGKIRASLNYYK